MKRILLLATILLIGFQSYSQKDTTMLVWYDTNVTWVMHVQNDYGGDYKIIATARPAEGKKLNGVAGMIINDTYGVTVDHKTKKEDGSMNQLSLTRRIKVKTSGKYVITGSVSWYMEGEKDVKKKNFRLVFINP
jgi:hypothetical protein